MTITAGPRPSAPKPAARAWYEIRNASDDVAEVFIYDQIGEDWFGEGTTAKKFAKEIGAITAKRIDLHLNSPGGSVFDGQAIANAISRHPATVTTFIDGLAASIASVIALAGDQVVMASNALYMIHEPSAFAGGRADDLRQMADLLDKVTGVMVGTYADKTGMSDEDLRAAMAAETWYTAAEALEAGFVDEIGVEQSVAASFDLAAIGFRNPPKTALPTPGVTATTPKGKPIMDEDEVKALVAAAIAEANSDPAGGTPPPAYIPAATVQDPFPYRPGVNASFFRDMLNEKKDPEAAARFQQATTMITAAQDSTDVAEVIPEIYRPDLYVDQLSNGRAVIDSFTKLSIDGPNVFRIPKFETAADLISTHVEGTNPTAGTIAFDEQLVTPIAKSGSYVASREMIEGSNPAVDAIIMNAIKEEYALDTEAYAITTFLAGATAGTVVDISDGATMQVRARMITFAVNRKRGANVFLAGETLFTALANQVDGAGRPLNPEYGATNAAGVMGEGLESLKVSGKVTPLVPVLTGGLLGYKQDAITFESGLRLWRWEEKSGPANIEFAAFGYIACAVIRAAGLLKFATQA